MKNQQTGDGGHSGAARTLLIVVKLQWLGIISNVSHGNGRDYHINCFHICLSFQAIYKFM